MDNRKRLMLLVAFTLLFGAQSVRVFIPSLVLYLYLTRHVNVWVMVAIGYGTFVLGFMASLLVRWLTPRGALVVAGMGLMLCRLVEQISIWPMLDVVASIGGTVCFLWLLPLLFGRARAENDEGPQAFTLGFLLGLSLDTLARGLTGTLDFSWIPGPWPILTIIGLVSLFGYILWRMLHGHVTLMDDGSPESWALMGPGLLLFVQALIFQSQGWVAQLTGWSSSAALTWIMFGNVGALYAASFAWRHTWFSTRWSTFALGGALTIALAFASVPGWPFAIGLIIGLVSGGLLLAITIGEHRGSAGDLGINRVSFSFSLGLLLFYILITLYYISLLVPVPFPRTTLAPAAGVGLTICALIAARQQPQTWVRQTANWKFVRWGALLLIFPVSMLMVADLPRSQPVSESGFPVRVMTYNIHGAYGLDGRQNVEAIARVIEEAQTDIVILQEIHRGWLLDGSTDLLPLLSRRLNMPYTVMNTPTDPSVGNAILSRYPIVATGQGTLPLLDTLIRRGYAWAQMDLGEGESLRVVVTHLHHEPERGDVRIGQVNVLLQALGRQSYTIFGGDMNAVSGSPEIQLILEAGFVDSWAEAGHGDRPPIDWIFHTPDLIARDIVKIENQASDHPAVVATIERKENP